MKKILDLLAKAGCKTELVTAIGESLEQYKTTIKEQFEADYSAKVEQAKKVCIEETEAHKRELARRVQIFLETKSAAIDANLQRQSAMNESVAVTKLKTVKSLLEGITVEQNGVSQNGQVPAVIEKAKQQIRQLTEERDTAVSLLNKKNAIAEKVLGRNRELVTENARLKAQGNGKVKPAVNEGRGAPRGQRIDSTRRANPPVTSRPTIVENQDRRPVAAPQAGRTQQVGGKNGFGIADIAGVMDDDLI